MEVCSSWHNEAPLKRGEADSCLISAQACDTYTLSMVTIDACADAKHTVRLKARYKGLQPDTANAEPAMS